MQNRSNEQQSLLSEQDRQMIANGLGLFSIGLGIAQILIPGRLAELIGVGDHPNVRVVMRAIGLREIASGIGILTRNKPVGWLRARVAGDVMDLALLGDALASDDTERGRVAAATASVVGVSILDMISSVSFNGHTKPIRVKKSITVNRDPEEVYLFWRNFENLPRFMTHLESVEVIDEQHSHWKVKAPAGKTVAWDAVMTEDIPYELISWQSLEGSDIYNAGIVRFKPAPRGQGTEVTVALHYHAPKLGAFIAKLMGEAPDQQIADDLRAFKQVMETGEIVISEGATPGQRLDQHPAQPPENPLLAKRNMQ